MSIVLGVTGSIATGKSTVTTYLKEQGLAIIDADEVAREVVQPETEGLAAIVNHFGETVLNQNQELDRKKLGSIVFSDEEQRQKLDAILGQLIKERLMLQLETYKKQNEPIIVCDIPLLFEAGYEKMMDSIMVVYVPESVQLTRLMARDQLTETEAKKRIISQMSIEDKKNKADVVIHNEGTLAETFQQVAEYLTTL